MEDFVPFLLAKKLKEKGFKEKCLTYYDVNDNVGLLYNTQYTDDMFPCQYTDLLQSHNTDAAVAQPDDSEYCVDAPTISQVLKWLRDKEIYVVPTFCVDQNDNGYWDFRMINLIDGTLIYDEIKNRYSTYELAALAGIKYVINNII